MRICITSQGKEPTAFADDRFGRCQYFMIYDSETREYVAVTNPGPSSEHGAGIAAAQAVLEKKIDVLITGSLGPNAASLIVPDIKVYRLEQKRVCDAQAAYEKGTLMPMDVSVASK